MGDDHRLCHAEFEPAFHYDDVIDCVRREIEKRKAVYPKLVTAKKLSQKLANYEIQCMRWALAMLVWQHDRDGWIAWMGDKPKEGVKPQEAGDGQAS